MATTDKYELEEVSYGTAGWNGILTTNHQRVDDHLHTRLLVTLGETVAASEALYLALDGYWYLAKANVSAQPAWGLAIEAGILNDQIRLQRIGPRTDAGWTWTPGLALWLSPTTPGALTHTKPAQFAQFMGMATNVTEILLQPEFPNEIIGTTTTTTTTTTSTTTTTTTSTTSTSTTTTTI